MSIAVLITPERLDRILGLGFSLYKERGERAAARGALMDAAVLCDALASEYAAQNSRRGRNMSKAKLDVMFAFKRAGDEIMRMRDRVSVPE